MSASFYERLSDTLKEIEADGLYKRERVITSQQFSQISVQSEGGSQDVLNFCANNYLGLANDPRLIEAAKTALDRYGYGVASVRFICGAQDVHRELERRLAAFTGHEDAILYCCRVRRQWRAVRAPAGRARRHCVGRPQPSLHH